MAGTLRGNCLSSDAREGAPSDGAEKESSGKDLRDLNQSAVIEVVVSKRVN